MAPSDKSPDSRAADARRAITPKFHHPGAGRRKARLHPKGRQTDPADLKAIRQLLGDEPRRRDLLIEYLHLIQDRYGCLAPGHLAALAEELRLPMAEIYEIATFYAHFDVIDGVGDGAKASDGAILPTVRVCESLCCAMAGAEKLLATLQSDLGGAARVIGAPCMGACANAPAVSIGARQIQDATPIRVTNALAASPPAGAASFPVYKDLKAYRADGGYRLLETCRAGTITPDEVMEALELADLRGMGGAFFPTARKWRLVAGQPGPRIVAINADEGEVGTFKDRYFLETDPHSVLEGMLIAAWAVDAAQVYFYLRDEYGDAREILAREITALGDAGIVGDQVRLELRRGAGAYICGEESAMIESIEGKRGLPRHRPPYVAEVGIFGRPTLVNNVETVYWARQILEKALVDPSGLDPLPEPLAVRAYSISGRVKEPGVKIAPIGLTMTELLQDHCGGMEDGHTFKAYLPGGASGGILPASLADLSLDQDSLIKYGCFVGAAAIVVLSDKDNIAEAALSLMKFFEHESCGQCSPCRVGTAKAVQLMQAEKWDVGLLRELSDVMRDASICGLGQAAPNPLDCVLDHFPEDIPQ